MDTYIKVSDMNEKELRIGNWVNCGIPEDNVDIEMGLVEFDERTIKNLLLPIPLTEKWLFKMGFRTSKKQYYDNYQLNFRCSIKFDDEDCLWYYSKDESDARCYRIKGVRFVHELQNLHFALTGKELTI